MLLKETFKTCFFLLLISPVLFAQSPVVSLQPYIFPEFVKSIVLQKGGASVVASLNYNTITQEMLFEKDGAKLVLDPEGNIDTIFIQNRKFIIAKQFYFEKLTNTAVALYVQYQSKAVLANKSGDANKVLSQAYKKGSVPKIDPYSLKLPDNYTLQTNNKYWLQKGSEFIQASNIKKITDLFPGKETQINNYIKENNISLTDENDLIKLISFSNK